MIRAETRRTEEGVRRAVEWLEEHRNDLTELRSTLVRYYSDSGRELPWRKTRDPYKILVTEVLLQKTGAKAVERIWGEFFRRYPDVQSLAAASAEDIESQIGILGLRKRARTLKEAARAIVLRTGGVTPSDAEFLKSIPGAGDYTAAAILSFAFDIKAAAIDVNAARVYTRIGGFAPNTLRQGLAFARVVGERVTAEGEHREINYAVLDLASQVCRPRPLCDVCPAATLCQYAGELSTQPTSLPHRTPTTNVTPS